MARDDAGGRANNGRDGSGGSDSWDFDLPDLGASTTPGHHRGQQRSQPASQRPSESSGVSHSSRGESVRGRQPEDLYRDHDPYAAHEDGYAGYGVAEEYDEADEYDDEAREIGPEVYRRRRIIALIIALLVIAAVAFGVMNMMGGDEEPEPAPVATAEPTNTDPFDGFTARPESEASDGASGPAALACGESLEISASTDEESYSEDTDPILILTLENTSDESCMVNAGTARMNYQITTGSDTVFDSAHCQIDGQDRPIELDPGETETARFEWDRHRSVADCATEGAEATAGVYRLTVALGETRSEGVEFTLE